MVSEFLSDESVELEVDCSDSTEQILCDGNKDAIAVSPVPPLAYLAVAVFGLLVWSYLFIWLF